MTNDYISIYEAARRSGLHINSLKRLLRSGRLHGYKTSVNGRYLWLVSVYSLDQYTNPFNGFLLDMPGPRLFLSKLDEDSEAEED